MRRRLRWTCIALTVAALAPGVPHLRAQASSPTAADAALARFFDAGTDDETAAASAAIAASRLTFDEVLDRLRRGRAYPADVPRGVVQQSRHADGAEYFYTLIVPDAYTPARRWQVRFQLHGGVGRIAESRAPRSAPGGRLDGAEQIVVLPYAWRDAPWWSRPQERNLVAILDQIKRSYNVDENRVVLAGVSDGGTGAYYMAMRQTTPFASFLPLNGFFMVLKNEVAERDGDLFPNNLRNKPLFVVNGGRDPLYPAAVVGPYVEHLKQGGVDVVYLPQPDAGHDTSWWPQLKDTFEQFVTAHPRQPLPDAMTWEADEAPARAHWLVIDSLTPASSRDQPLADINQRSTPAVPEFGVRASGNRINRVVAGSNAQQFGLRSGDVVTFINSQPIGPDIDLDDVLSTFPQGRPVILTVNRGSTGVRLTGRYAPTPLPRESELMFPPSHASGRVDVTRAGNRVTASTRGVAAFTVLLSPDQFDFSRPVTIVVNGRTVFDAAVARDVGTLLKWAAQDHDRTMLFGAEVSVRVPQ